VKVLVVGASGLVGQHVVGRLRARGHGVTSVAWTARDGVDHTLDATTAAEAEFRALFAGHDGVVFAAGADDREVPRGPAYPVFHRGNVASVVRLLTAAREEGLSRAVVLGSYYTHFHRLHPEWGRVAAAYVEHALASDPTSADREPPAFRAPTGAMKDSFHLATGRRLWHAGTITARTLVLRGEHDFWSREGDVSTLVADLVRAKDVRAVRLDGATHFAHLDRAERGRDRLIEEVSRWLS
jgi:hypothetical protein